MSKPKVAIVYGTRPEAIKLAPLIKELWSRDYLEIKIISTGQHTSLLEGIMTLWEIIPDYELVQIPSKGLTDSTIELMRSLTACFENVTPDVVVVQGDTTSAMVAALHAHQLRIPVFHVEAGLRSHDLWNPWPEEANRRMIDSISSQHFAPTQSALQNLVREGMGESATLTGNTIVDSLHHVNQIIEDSPELLSNLESALGIAPSEPLILFTQHRREAFGKGQVEVFQAIAQLAKTGIKVVFPVHPNPNVRELADQMFQGEANIHLVPPLGYLPFIQLIKRSSLVISDSGGLQEEVPTFGKKILITRETTERHEVIEAGFGSLVGFSRERIVGEALTALSNREEVNGQPNPFGDGKASFRIANKIDDFLGLGPGSE